MAEHAAIGRNNRRTSPMRVLQGVTGQAGQPQAFAKGLISLGVEARTCQIVEHKFNYGADISVEFRGAHTLEAVHERLAPLIDAFDIFHFHGRSFVMEWPELAYPSCLDILLLKLAGKKVFFHFRGQEIRLAESFAAINPYHYVNEPAGSLFKMLPDWSKKRLRDLATGLCDGVFVPDPELQGYVPGAEIVPRVLDDLAWPNVGVGVGSRPLVIHAPSRRGVKGTPFVLKAVDSLKAKGIDFEFRLVENMPHSQARQLYEKADIVVDQLRIGWYGVLAVEAMALGKPVICYIREDLWHAYGEAMPIANADPGTIEGVLEALLLSPERRRELAAASRAYFLKIHRASEVARQVKEIYERPPKEVDLAAFARFLDTQCSTQTKRGAALTRDLERKAWKLWHIVRAEGVGEGARLVTRHLRRRLRRS